MTKEIVILIRWTEKTRQPPTKEGDAEMQKRAKKITGLNQCCIYFMPMDSDSLDQKFGKLNG